MAPGRFCSQAVEHRYRAPVYAARYGVIGEVAGRKPTGSIRGRIVRGRPGCAGAVSRCSRMRGNIELSS
jgi:hypothetical protein